MFNLQRKLLAVPIAAAALVIGGATMASASTSHPTTCPSGITGGGGCHYMEDTYSVPGATGTMTFQTFYHLSSGGGSYEVYDGRVLNNSSRAYNVTSTSLTDGAITYWSMTGGPSIAQNGGSGNGLIDYRGHFISGGPLGNYWGNNSASGGNFLKSNTLP